MWEQEPSQGTHDGECIKQQTRHVLGAPTHTTWHECKAAINCINATETSEHTSCRTTPPGQHREQLLCNYDHSTSELRSVKQLHNPVTWIM